MYYYNIAKKKIFFLLLMKLFLVVHGCIYFIAAKPSQSPVMTQSKQDEKLSLPEPTTFSSMDEMYLWLQKTVKRIEENVAKIACENNKRVESVEKKYREMKSHFEELEAYVHKSAIVMSSSPSQISLPQSCEGSFDEGTTETELSAKSSESLSVQLMFKCNMTPSFISSSSVPSNLLCPPSHQPLVPKSSLPPDQRHVKRKSQAPPEVRTYNSIRPCHQYISLAALL